MNDFGKAVFTAIRTGVPDLVWVEPRDYRTIPITNELMLAHNEYRLQCRRRVAQHAGGEPIRNRITKAMKRQRVEAIRAERKSERGRRRATPTDNCDDGLVAALVAANNWRTT
jgi:hypothetical protein